LFVWRIWREDRDRRCIEVTVSYSYPVSGRDHVRKFRQTYEERTVRQEGIEQLPRYMEGDTVEVRYNPRDHAHSTLKIDVEHLMSSGASLLKWGLACVLFGMLGAGLARPGENE
jgi:hypothetical protein